MHPKPAQFYTQTFAAGHFRGVCNTPLHGYVKNPSNFTLPDKDTPKTRPVLYPNRRRGTFHGVCFCAPTRVRAKIVRFHISVSEYTKNAPDFTLPNRDTPQNPPGFRPKPSARLFEGRMQYAPTWVREKFDGFHISPPEYPKNAPDFTLPNRDTPKTRQILGPNLRQGLFRGVCNTPLHGYVQNLAGFIFPHTDTPKTHPISLFPIGMPQNPPGFTPKPSVQDISGRMLLRPYTDTCKTHPVLHLNHRRRTFRGVCNTPLHGYVQNLAGFIFPHLNTPKTYPISSSPIKVHPKPI